MLKYIKRLVSYTTQKEASKEYEKIKTSIISLSKHPEYKDLLDYWIREYTRIDEAIDRSNEKECFLLIKERAIIKKHLLWLEQMTTQEQKEL